MADGRHIENRFFGYIWTIYFLINAKFRTKEHNYTQTHMQITWPKYSFSRHLNSDNKTANINVKKTVVYLQFIMVKWHIENSKNNERWYITLEAHWHWRSGDAKVISPCIIFAVFDVSFRRYKL